MDQSLRTMTASSCAEEVIGSKGWAWRSLIIWNKAQIKAGKRNPLLTFNEDTLKPPENIDGNVQIWATLIPGISCIGVVQLHFVQCDNWMVIFEKEPEGNKHCNIIPFILWQDNRPMRRESFLTLQMSRPIIRQRVSLNGSLVAFCSPFTKKNQCLWISDDIFPQFKWHLTVNRTQQLLKPNRQSPTLNRLFYTHVVLFCSLMHTYNVS